MNIMCIVCVDIPKKEVELHAPIANLATRRRHLHQLQVGHQVAQKFLMILTGEPPDWKSWKPLGKLAHHDYDPEKEGSVLPCQLKC